MSSVAGVTVTPVAYRVTIWPEQVRCMDAALWCCTVTDCGHGNWAVLRGGMNRDEARAPVLGRDWLWHYENLPSGRTEKEIADHRFTLEDALERARETAPRVNINGLTAVQALARHEAKGHCVGCEGPYTA